MKNRIAFLMFGLIQPVLLFCQYDAGIAPEAQAKLRMLKKEVTENLTTNILSYWSSRMPDYTNNGFFGRIDSKEEVHSGADKGGILNARILWTFSSAYRITHDKSYLNLATRARDYIITNFIDSQYGGAFRSLKADGTPADTRKQLYTNAFFIYGLSEYCRATGDRSSLAEARKIFDLFEKHAADKEFNGYYESFTRDWQRDNSNISGGRADKDEKTMNTSLHIMEAYANLYRVSDDKAVGDRLRNIVEIFLDKIIDKETSHLICFLDRQWSSTSTVNSFGHDIECSWLLFEAADLLGDKNLTDRVREVSIRMVNAATEGYQPDGSMLSEKNYTTGLMETRRSWWEQAETVVGYLNAFELTGDESYLVRSLKCWEYIKQHFVDYKNGGWFTSVSEEGVAGGDKAGFWICPYHNGRMCMEVMERAGQL